MREPAGELGKAVSQPDCTRSNRAANEENFCHIPIEAEICSCKEDASESTLEDLPKTRMNYSNVLQGKSTSEVS